jgi:ATP-dependent Zn protease
MWLIRKAKKLARKWGGQCIIFIDEIDAVGMRRASIGGGTGRMGSQSFEDYCFFGPWGALTPTGDLILETRAWRERLFALREEPRPSPVPPLLAKPAEWAQRFMFPGMFGGGMGGLALNQLLVQMDGIGEAPFMRRFFTNRINTILDAMYLVPRRIGRAPLRLPSPRPSTEQVFFIGATNVPIDRLDPALIRPGRMGRHVWFRTPTLEDRKDIFNLYLGKVDHETDLDTERRRDELARITNGYAPAMIEQVCSLALTNAHADGRETFDWPDIVEAMTTVEAGTAVAIDYIPEETRAVAIHEAGHAINGHLYMKDVLSTRLSIRKRGESLGHHQAIQTQERFSSWRSEEFAKLVWTLGAMAAEHVFYGENSTGVGGDVMSATARAAWMVGYCAMGPNPIDLNGRFPSADDEAAEREKLLGRFEEIGVQIMRRAGTGGPFDEDPIAGTLNDRDKRKAVATLLGQAYVTAYATVASNRDQAERVTDTLIQRKEMHGDEVVDLLNSVGLVRPKIDLLAESTWPTV